MQARTNPEKLKDNRQGGRRKERQRKKSKRKTGIKEAKTSVKQKAKNARDETQ